MCYFVKQAQKKASVNLSISPVQHLINELNDRDEPMLRHEIAEVFKQFGHPFTQADIDACHPDSVETVQEQIDYYRE